MVFAAVFMLAFYGAGMFYVGWRLFNWLKLVIPGRHKAVSISIFVFFFASIAISFLPLDLGIKNNLVWFAWFLIGIYILFLTFFAFSDVIKLIGRLIRLIPKPTPKTFTIVTGWIVLIAVAVLAAVGTYNGQQVRHASYNITITDKETSLDRLNIVLISDTHLGYLNDDKWLAKVASEINAAQPDIVVIAGDIFNDNYRTLINPEEAARALQGINSTYGVYACIGNHDGGDTHHEMLDFLERGNVNVLMDEFAVIDDKFVIVGRNDPMPVGGVAPERGELTGVMAGIDTSMPIIVMDHQPGHAGEYGNEVDLILSGHTHQGQFFPATVITYLMNGPLNYGHYQSEPGSPHIVVTSGAGLWGPPLRVGSSNEVVSVLVEFK